MSYRILENNGRRELESIIFFRVLEGTLTISYPDPFSATAFSKTQSFLAATAMIEQYNPFGATTIPKTQSFFAATAAIKTQDPFAAKTQLLGAQP